MMEMMCNSREFASDEYGWLENDEAKSYLRDLFNRGEDSRSDYRVLCNSINGIYLTILRIRDEISSSYTTLSTCIELLNKYLHIDPASEHIPYSHSNLHSELHPNIHYDTNSYRPSQHCDTQYHQHSDTQCHQHSEVNTETHFEPQSELQCVSQCDTEAASQNNDFDYTFPLASCVKCSCLLKIVVNHAVAGLYIGKNGAHLKSLQSKFQFKLTQSGRGAKGDFTGVGYPCHRTNTTLLFQGNLVDILQGLRPLYSIIQSDILALDERSMAILGGRKLKVKFELNLVVPADRKRILLQDTGRRCMQLRNASGVEIIAGKQNFEVGNIRESIVTLFGFEENVERAMEWLGIFLQESPAITSGDYFFMDYPKYTTAIPETSRT